MHVKTGCEWMIQKFQLLCRISHFLQQTVRSFAINRQLKMSQPRWWNPADGFPQQPHRQAMVQAQIAKLVASGQPKDSLLVFTREG